MQQVGQCVVQNACRSNYFLGGVFVIPTHTHSSSGSPGLGKCAPCWAMMALDCPLEGSFRTRETSGLINALNLMDKISIGCRRADCAHWTIISAKSAESVHYLPQSRRGGWRIPYRSKDARVYCVQRSGFCGNRSTVRVEKPWHKLFLCSRTSGPVCLQGFTDVPVAPEAPTANGSRLPAAQGMHV